MVILVVRIERTQSAAYDENNLIAVKGAVPGPNGGIVVIRDSVKA